MLRTHRCGEVKEEHVGETVQLAGWVDGKRDLGSLTFLDLRDVSGVLQIVFDQDRHKQLHKDAKALGQEDVVRVEGKIIQRAAENINPKLPTGTIEVLASSLDVLNRSETPPFEIRNDVTASEELRLTYRYLDLRRPSLQRNLLLRHRLSQRARAFLSENGFIELETPFLTRSTPEGARDYLVPSRLHHGKFYALPQSPQIFKQLLMIAGFDRYFQIVKCFRDEELRADRQPEFTQIDIEMSFPEVEDILHLTEGLMLELFDEAGQSSGSIERMKLTYDEAMSRYGSDKPDPRIGMELHDLSSTLAGSSFRIFRSTVEAGGSILGIAVPSGATLGKGQLDALEKKAKEGGAPGLLWLKVTEDGLESPFAQHLVQDASSIREELDANPGDLLLLMAGEKETVQSALGFLRETIGRDLDLYSKDVLSLVWVTDFPLFEYDHAIGRFAPTNHPFTAPQEADLENLSDRPESVRAQSYDLILNGYEIAGGSIRNHRVEVQEKIFQILGLSPDEIQDKFSFLLRALRYGAPPHGGIALGFDRIVMVLANGTSLRDVIPFPKTTSASSLLSRAPSSVTPEQLAELGLLPASKEEGEGGQ